MKKLLKKELTLTANPLSYVFILFALMTMIPGYPIVLGAFFVCMGIFYSFQFAREDNDILYTALLPVRKSDVVRAKYGFSVLLELASFLLAAILTVLRITLMEDVTAYASNALLNANIAFLGHYLIVLGLFNVVFVRGFFKTAYKIGKPFLLYCIAAMVWVGVSETLPHLPGLSFLASRSGPDLLPQCVVLGIGILFFVFGTLLAMKSSIKSFEKIDL